MFLLYDCFFHAAVQNYCSRSVGLTFWHIFEEFSTLPTVRLRSDWQLRQTRVINQSINQFYIFHKA